MNQYVTGAVIKELRQKSNMTQAVLAMVVFDTPKGCVGVWKTIVLVQREQARLSIDKINSDDIKQEI